MKDDSLKEKTLLVVDDEADLREIISMELEYFGATVYQAESVSKALEVLNNHSIDLIISDIRMPGSTGVDLLKTVREQNVSLPAIILITGFADLDISEAFALGAEALVHKPFNIDELLDLVSGFLLDFPDRYKSSPQSQATLPFYFDRNFDDESVSDLEFGRGGVKVFHKDRPIPLGQARLIEFHFKDKTLSFEGVVRWKKVTESGVTIGIEYTNLDDEMIDVARKFQTNVSYIPS